MSNVIQMKNGWETQVIQYAHRGAPGIHLEQHTIEIRGSKTMVDCLLYRDENGLLVGILNHYNENNPLEKPGAVNLWVEPHHQHQGIASVLLRDAWHRWPLKVEHQTWTKEGEAWINGLVEKGKVDPTITTSLNEDCDWTPAQDELHCWWRDGSADIKGS